MNGCPEQRGLRTAGQLGCVALLFEESGGMSGRWSRKTMSVDCAGRDGAVDVGTAAPRITRASRLEWQ